MDLKEGVNIGVLHAGATHVGKCRTENQDSYGFVRRGDSSLFVVADGMGGAKGGAIASGLAVDVICKEALDESGRITKESIHSAVEKANTAIHEFSKLSDSLSGMGTTAVVLGWHAGKLFIAHVGDSRAYVYREQSGELRRLTKDHTLVQELLDAGSIAKPAAENHPISHMLTRSLGPHESVSIDVQELSDDLLQGDRFLLCCDGLYNHVSDEGLQEVLGRHELEMAAEVLVSLANEAGGSDNITVQIVEFHQEAASEAGANKAAKTESFNSSGINYEGLKEAFKNARQADKEAEAKQTLVNGVERVTDDTNIDSTPTASASQKTEDIGERRERLANTNGRVSGSSGAQDAPKKEGEKVASEYKKLEDTESFGQVNSLERFQILALGCVLAALVVCIYVAFPREDSLPPKTQPLIASVTTRVPADAVSPSVDTGSVLDRDSASSQIVKAVPMPTGVTESTLPALDVPPNEKKVVSDMWPSVEVLPEERPAWGSGSTHTSDESQANASNEASPVLESGSSAPIGVVALNDLGANATETKERVNPPSSEGNVGSASVDESASMSELELAELKSFEEKERTLAKVVLQASDISVPPPPESDAYVVAIRSSANEPIVWEHEKTLRDKFISEALSYDRSVGESDGDVNFGALNLNLSVRAEVIKEKLLIREKIADIDSKLRAYGLGSEDALKRRISEIEQQIALLDEAYERTMDSLDNAAKRYAYWLGQKGALNNQDPLALALELAENNLQVKRTKEAHDVSLQRKGELESLWKDNPSKDEYAAQMSMIEQELASRRIALIQAVELAIDGAMELAKFDLSENALLADDLKRQKSRLNRHFGHINVFGSLANSSRSVQQKVLMDNRRELVNKLGFLQKKVSDDQEVEIRRKLAFERLNF